MRFNPISWSTLVVFAIAFHGAAARADAIYSIDSPNSAVAPYPGPYGTVDVHLIDSTHANVTLTALNQGSNNFLFGGAGVFALNTNGSASIVGSVTATQPGTGIPSAGAGPITGPGSGQVDGQGNFNFVLDSFDGAAHAVNGLSFEIQKTSGTWSSDANVLTANGNNLYAAGHIFVYNSDYTLNPATGYAGADPVDSAPEPSTVILASMGIFGVCFPAAWRRFRRS